MTDLDQQVVQETVFARKVQVGDEQVIIPKKKTKLIEWGIRTLPAVAYALGFYLPVRFLAEGIQGVYNGLVQNGNVENLNGDVADVVTVALTGFAAFLGFRHYRKINICDQTLQIDSITKGDTYSGDRKELYPCCENITEDEVYEATSYDWKAVREIQDDVLVSRGYRHDSKRDFSFTMSKLKTLQKDGFLLSNYIKGRPVYKRTSAKRKRKIPILSPDKGLEKILS